MANTLVNVPNPDFPEKSSQARVLALTTDGLTAKTAMKSIVKLDPDTTINFDTQATVQTHQTLFRKK